jgi:hypothetical protein
LSEMTAPIGMDSFVTGLGVGALTGVLGAPALWRWVGWHAWKTADREARLDQPASDSDLADWSLLFEDQPAEERRPSR